MRHTLAVATGLWLAGARAFAAQPPAHNFSATTEVLAIEVPVTVVVDGAPVRGLKAENFEVLEGKQPLRIVGFEAVDLERAAAAPLPGAVLEAPHAAARRHVVLLFDLDNSRPRSLEHARSAAHEIVRGSLKDTDLVAVAAYSPTSGARIVLGFTSDREEVHHALDRLESTQRIARAGDPLRLTLAELDDNAAQAAFKADQLTPDPGDGPRAGAQARQAQKQALSSGEAADTMRLMTESTEAAGRETAQARLAAMTTALGDFARLLGTVPGRKLVLLLSEGFDSALATGAGTSEDDNQAIENGTAVYRVDAQKRYGSLHSQAGLEKMLDEFRRGGCVIEAVDVGGLRASADAQEVRVGVQTVGADRDTATSGQDSLFLLANETGGDLFRNTNDLAASLGAALRKSTVTYVLTVDPGEVLRNGAFHPLTVKLHAAARSARLSARAGYYAPRPYAQKSAAERGLDAAGLIVAGEEGGRLDAALVATPLVTADGKARIATWLEVNGEDLTRDQQEPTVKVEVFLYALDARGKVRDHLSQTLTLDLAKLASSLAQRGVKLYGELELPAGDYLLRGLVRNASTGASALHSVQLRVAPEASAQLFLPMIPEPPGRWLFVPAHRDGEPVPTYPFAMAERPILPTTRAVLLADQEVPLCLFGFGLGEEQGLRVYLRGADGKERELPTKLRGHLTSPDRLERWVLSLEPTDTPPGNYDLWATSADGAARSPALRLAVSRRSVAPESAR